MITTTAQAGSTEFAATPSLRGPSRWPDYALAVGAASVVIGILWDISWHSTIGRDTFWTPAHMAVYFGGSLAGFVCGWLAIKCTFFPNAHERATSVSVFGARAPLGAWITIWGALAMLTSAPFDDWWHNAYGLDVKIISPPHSILGLGMFGISTGALILVLARQNRESSTIDKYLFVFVSGVFVTLGAIFVTEFSYPNRQHGAAFYIACSIMFAFRLVTVGRAARISWPTTRVAAAYMLMVCGLIWALPLFAGHPKLAPIFNPVTHMVPPPFPVILIIPAIGIDLILRTIDENDDGLKRVGRAVAIGTVFLALMFATHWFSSEFLLSPLADNWFFAGQHFYGYRNAHAAWHGEFWDSGRFQSDQLTPFRILIAWGFACITSWLGLLWGGWMRKVKR